MAFLLLLVLPGQQADKVDWRALVQKPFGNIAVPDYGLRPLLVSDDGGKIASKADWEKSREKLRQRWLARLGPAPEKPANLDVRVDKTEHLDGFTRQLLSFTGEGDDRIRSFLLIPDGLKKGDRRPAVVVFHSTNRDTLKEGVGLSQSQQAAFGLHLVRRGYVVLCPECYILKDLTGWARGQAAALARRRPGWTGMGKMTFDASRCIDFLETLPQVDATRIGCIGFSLGAKEVLYAMAFEPRYRAGVSIDGGVGLRMSNWTDPWYLTEKMKEHMPAMENHQVLALVAPRPILIMGGDDGSGDKAIADGDKSWAFIKEVLPVYQLHNGEDRIGLFNHRKGHTVPQEARRLAYRWLDDWLQFNAIKDEVGD